MGQYVEYKKVGVSDSVLIKLHMPVADVPSTKRTIIFHLNANCLIDNSYLENLVEKHSKVLSSSGRNNAGLINDIY